MPNLKGVLVELGSIFQDDYKAGVEHATDKKIIYLNPEELAKIPEADRVAFLRDKLEREAPGITKDTTDAELKEFVVASLNDGPWAYKAEVGNMPVCIVNEPAPDLDNRGELVSLLSGHKIEELAKIPGFDRHWERLVGIHEGTHCEQEPILLSYSDDKILKMSLKGEAEADRAAIKWLKDHGYEDIAQAFKDYRALGAGMGDTEHDTSIFLSDNKPITITDEHTNAAQVFRTAMATSVEDHIIAKDPELQELQKTDPAGTLAVAMDRARDLLRNDPKQYFDIVDQAAKDGKFDGTPYVRDYIEDYTAAYRRQILDKGVEPSEKYAYQHQHAPRELAEQPAPEELAEYRSVADDYDLTSLVGHEKPQIAANQPDYDEPAGPVTPVPVSRPAAFAV